MEEVLAGSGRGVILRTSWVMGLWARIFSLPCGGCTANVSRSSSVQEPVVYWCDAGPASWFDVAVAVGELAQELGFVEQPEPVNPLTTAE